jgi:hypothetical protein
LPVHLVMPSALAGGDPHAGWVEVPAQARELLVVLFPHLAGLEVGRVADTGDAVVAFASVRGAQARCPGCGQPSSRVHGRYQRLLADGAAGGRPLLIALSVRRFRCASSSCPRITFVEQAEGLTGRYLRRTLPLRELLARFGLELAGRAGARLAAALGIAVHSSTLLRLVMALPDPVVTASPRVTGVDDFALRRGQVYGTVVADAESGQVIDLLPDREAATLEEWLKARPGAEVICRDRATGYSDGASAGAPLAVQVADRWHLRHNLGEYAEKAVAAHRGCLAGAPGAPAPGTGQSAPPGQEPDGLRDVLGRERALVARTLERHAAVHELLRRGRSQREAADILGLDRKTVGRFAAEADPARLLVKATGRAGKPARSSPGSTAAGTKASPMPPRCTPRSPPRAGRAASRPSSATSASSAPPTAAAGPAATPAWPRRSRRPPRPARSPAGCSPILTASTPPTRHGSTPPGRSAPTWTTWPATCATSPRS